VKSVFLPFEPFEEAIDAVYRTWFAFDQQILLWRSKIAKGNIRGIFLRRANFFSSFSRTR